MLLDVVLYKDHNPNREGLPMQLQRWFVLAAFLDAGRAITQNHSPTVNLVDPL